MKVAIFSAKAYDRQSLEAANLNHNHELTFFETQLNPRTALLAKDIPVVCPFVNDQANAEILKILASNGTHLLALRSAGFNNVDLKAAADLGIGVVRVPAYSPYAVAEHTVALVLMLNRKLYRAYNRVRDDNFSLEGLLGFDLHGCTIGVIGTGKIGMILPRSCMGLAVLCWAMMCTPILSLKRLDRLDMLSCQSCCLRQM